MGRGLLCKQVQHSFWLFQRSESPSIPIWAGNRKKSRGMSVWHDLVDWVGGYPFEVAKPEEIFDFYRRKGFLPFKAEEPAAVDRL